jgi:hypothetical protein
LRCGDDKRGAHADQEEREAATRSDVDHQRWPHSAGARPPCQGDRRVPAVALDVRRGRADTQRSGCRLTLT